jgi:hypothetical protein
MYNLLSAVYSIGHSPRPFDELPEALHGPSISTPVDIVLSPFRVERPATLAPDGEETIA